MSSIRWLPLESNPEVMNKFLANLGVPKKWGISDIISLDEELLDMIPSPSLALLLLFPVKCRENCKKEEESAVEHNYDKDVYFMKQTIGNACGTVALIHAVANNEQCLNIKPGSVLKKFLDETKELSPEEKGKALEANEDISADHDACAQEGQTEAPSIDESVNLHFIALVNVNGKLYELDGRKAAPIQHGPTSQETFIKDACHVCKEYMERDPENINFTALSFGAI